MDEEFHETLGDGFDESHRKLVEDLENETRKIGLYMDYARVMPGDEEGTKLMVHTSFLVGDIAWSTRVQDPDQHEIDKQFQSVTDGLEDEQLNEVRRKLEGMAKDEDSGSSSEE